MAEAYVYDDEPMEDLEDEAEVGGDPWVLTAISSSNLAFELSEQVLQSIGGKVYDEFCIDEQSLTDNGWTERHESAMKLAMQVKEAKSYPWQDACLSLDTDILTRDGWKPITDVKVGDEVLSRSPDGVAAYQQVSRTFKYTAPQVVHFKGKSIDLLATTNHNMLVEDRDNGETSFIEAGEFLTRRLSRKAIPLTSMWDGETPDKVYGIDAKAYVRFLGWYISEGAALYGRNVYTNVDGEFVDYGLSPSSFSIAQSKKANPEKYDQLRADIEACGFSYKAYDKFFIVHAKSMPDMLKAELRGLGKVSGKHIPRHVLGFSGVLLAELLDTLVAGDGTTTKRSGRKDSRYYFTVSALLADQVQELCQKVGLRGTLSMKAAQVGGVINGRQVEGAQTLYTVTIGTKPAVQVLKLERSLVQEATDVACVEVYPHNTIYVRRNGRAVWVGNSNVKYPLLTTAAIQFAARAYPAIVDGFNVVKGKVLGQPTDEKRDRADRVARHMSYQLLEEMEGWESDTDKLLHMLPIVGTVFRKTYFDSSLGYNCSELVPPEKGVANYWTRNLESCPRFTHVCEYYRNEIEEKFRSELWKRVELGASDSDDDYAPECFLEQHRLLDLDEDGYPEPYIVTVHKESRQVVRIVARWDEDGVEMTPRGEILRIKPVQYFTKYSFIPSLDGSFYDIGFGTLLNALNETINTTINQLMDAGHLSNVQGGFLGTGISIKSGGNRFKPGEWKRVETQGGALKDSIVPLPVREPSAVLFQLLGMLVEAARDITATKDVLTGDTTPQNQPVGTTLALIEQGLKVYSAIYKRIHRAFKWELNKLRRLNKLYLDPQVYFTFQDSEGAVSQQDYATEDVDVIPVSDPTVVMDSQRLARAQYLQQFMQLPFMNQKRIVERALEAGNIPDIEELFVEQGPSPQAMMEAEKLKQSGDKIKLDAIKVAAQREKDAADITRTKADSAKVLVETAAIMQEHAIVQVPPLEPPDLSGMEGAPGDGGVLPVPPGPSGPPDAGMGGVGGGNAPMGAPESLSVPGAGGPEMV